MVVLWRNGIGCLTYDREVVGSTSGQVAIKWFTILGCVTVCGQVNYLRTSITNGWKAGVKVGRVHLCQVAGNTV